MKRKASHIIILLATYITGLSLFLFLCYSLILHPMFLYAKEHPQQANELDPSSAASFTQALEQMRADKKALEEAALQVPEEPQPDLNPSISKAAIETPVEESPYATIIIERLGMSVPLYYGDSKAQLRKGAGQYTGPGSSSFGEGKQIIVAGHNTKEFKPLQHAAVGDVVKVVTSYGEFAYTIVRIEVHDMNDTSSYDLNLDHEQLAMYTCYPFTGPPGKTQRYFCYCDKLYGPVLTD